MSFTVSDLQDFLTLLREHPDWRDAVRHEVLTDDFQALPRIAREQAEALARTDVRLAQLVDIVARLGERVDQLGQRMDQLTERMDQLGQRMDQLTITVGALVATTTRLEGRMGNVEGSFYEQRYRDNVASRLGLRLRQAKRVQLNDIAPLIAAADAGQVSDEAWDDLSLSDIVVRGRVGSGADAREQYYVMEISVAIDSGDVERAHRRAGILARAGVVVQACVAGPRISRDAEPLASSLGVTVLLDRDGG